MNPRTRGSVAMAIALAALLALLAVAPAGAAEPATAGASSTTASSRAVSGNLLVSVPREEALVKRAPVRVVVRVPAGTTRLRVTVGGRDVSRRFRPKGGHRRVARLTRADGLRYGDNHLVVLAERRGGKRVIDTRSFVFAHRAAGLVRLRVRKGPVTSLSIRVAGGLKLTPAHFRRRGAVARRLSVMQRERTVRLWLNGHRVAGAIERSHLTRWTASLSATHGLRHGVNRLRVKVVEPETGRYSILRRRFVVSRHWPLAAAGWDRGTPVGARVRLDGSDSRGAGTDRPKPVWRIVSKPRGSRATLHRPRTERPSLTPDRPGSYVIANTVKAPATRGRAARVSTDRVTVTAGPRSQLIPFTGITVKDGKFGIQVGDTFYANPSPNGSALQWLTLDRSTLDPTTAVNTWLDGSGSGDHGLDKFTAALSKSGLDQLMVLSYPLASRTTPPIQKDQVDDFNRALKGLGVGPIDKGILADHNKLVIAGVPSGGAGSGRYIHGGVHPDGGLKGWLMPDATLSSDRAMRYRIQPERPEFATSSKATGNTNTMTIRDQPVVDALPAGASGGFQVTLINPTDFTVDDHRVFATNGGNDPVGGTKAMAAYLNAVAPSTTSIAVQSIGQVTKPEPPDDPYAPNPDDSWRAVASALTLYGANPNTFYMANGAYAFVGGTQLDKDEVSQSSTAVVIDPVKGQRQSGTLSGRANMRTDGYFAPAVVDASKSFEFSLYDMAFTPPTPWPYTAGAAGVSPAEAPAYEAALSYISTHLPLLAKWGKDVRLSYAGNDDIEYEDSRADLVGMSYPGTSTTCGQSGSTSPGSGAGADPGFTQAQFCDVNKELQKEFEWVDATKKLFAAWAAALGTSGSKQQVDLHEIGQDIINQIDRPIGGSPVGWTVGGFVGNMASAGLVLNPAVEPLAAWEALVVVYDLIRELVSDANGAPVGEQVVSKVNDLSADVANRLAAGSRALDGMRDVMVSDYGRLQALGTVAFSPAWAIDTEVTSETLTTAADGFFRTQLMPIAYDTVWYVNFADNGNNTTDTCRGPFFTHPWRGAPATGQMQWNATFDAGDDGKHRSGLWLLGKTGPGTGYAPDELTDPMFKPLAQNGAGVSLSDFFWTKFKNPPTDVYICHG